jgi:hypothetical protein
VKISVIVLYIMIPYNLVGVHRRFGGIVLSIFRVAEDGGRNFSNIGNLSGYTMS